MSLATLERREVRLHPQYQHQQQQLLHEHEQRRKLAAMNLDADAYALAAHGAAQRSMSSATAAATSGQATRLPAFFPGAPNPPGSPGSPPRYPQHLQQQQQQQQQQNAATSMRPAQAKPVATSAPATAWQDPAKDIDIRIAAAKRIANIFRQGSKNRDERREYRVLVALEHLCYRSAKSRQEFTDPRAFEILLHRVASEKAKRRRDSGNSRSGASFQDMLRFFLDVGNPRVAAAAAAASGLSSPAAAAAASSSARALTTQHQHMQRMQAAANATNVARTKPLPVSSASSSSSSSFSSSPATAPMAIDTAAAKAQMHNDRRTSADATDLKTSPQSVVSRRSNEGPHLFSVQEDPASEAIADRARLNERRLELSGMRPALQYIPPSLSGGLVSPLQGVAPLANTALDTARYAAQDRPDAAQPAASTAGIASAGDWNAHEQQPSPVSEARLFGFNPAAYGLSAQQAAAYHQAAAQNPDAAYYARLDQSALNFVLSSPRRASTAAHAGTPLSSMWHPALASAQQHYNEQVANHQQQLALQRSYDAQLQQEYYNQQLAACDPVAAQHGVKRNLQDVLRSSIHHDGASSVAASAVRHKSTDPMRPDLDVRGRFHST